MIDTENKYRRRWCPDSRDTNGVKGGDVNGIHPVSLAAWVGVWSNFPFCELVWWKQSRSWTKVKVVSWCLKRWNWLIWCISNRYYLSQTMHWLELVQTCIHQKHYLVIIILGPTDWHNLQNAISFPIVGVKPPPFLLPLFLCLGSFWEMETLKSEPFRRT